MTDLYNILMDTAKIVVPTTAGAIVLWFQLQRNKRQQAEGTFFNLLNSIRSLVENTKGNISPLKNSDIIFEDIDIETYKGLDYFYHANQELHDRLMKRLGETMVYEFTSTKAPSEEDRKKAHQAARDAFNKFFEDHLPELSHYFRFTYNVISFVDTHENILPEKKKQYVNFIQAQMSDSELQLLYYNGIGKHGKKFYDLIEKYNFLQNIDTSKNKGLIDFLDKFYPNSSFRD